MLYDPKWEKQAKTKAKPTLAGFIAWLEQQDPKTEYTWSGCDNCAIAQYVKSIGYKDAEDISGRDYQALENGDVCDGDGKRIFIALDRPHTFGDALKRARMVAARL